MPDGPSLYRSQFSGVFFRYADLLTTGQPYGGITMFLVGLWVGRSGMLTDMTPWIPTAGGFASGDSRSAFQLQRRRRRSCSAEPATTRR